jgi:2,4-diaminopentanoate dehydrogenase
VSEPLRVVQWTTGNVARQTVRAVVGRPDLALVGAYAWSPDKAGVDVGTLVGLDPIGVTATSSVEELLALDPDCVVYTPLHVDVPELAALLRAGVDVVTSSELVTGRSLGPAAVATLASAATDGGATLFGSGMNPGFAQLVAGVLAGMSLDVRHVRVTESVDTSLFAGDANMEDLGWGRPLGDPGHAADVEAAVKVFDDGVDVLARMLGVALDSTECVVTFAAATRDLDLPGRPIAAGGVAGIDVRWSGRAGGREVVELAQRWVMGSGLEPDMPVEHGYLVEVDADPQVRAKVDIWPDQDLATLTPEAIHAIGMRITGVPVVNAIPAVVAAPPGLHTYATLPLITGQIVV